MKRHLSAALFLAVAVFCCLPSGCKKKTEEAQTPCKTCTATGVDGSTQKQVCSEAEETAFRNQNAGKQISCR